MADHEKVPFKIVTPQGTKLDTEITFGVFPSPQGEVGVLPNHSPTLIALQSGLFSIETPGAEEKTSYFVRSGFLHVQPNEVLLLTPFADSKEDLDKERAEQSQSEAKKRLESRDESIDKERAREALHRSESRLHMLLSGE